MGRASVFKSAACPTGQVEQQVASAFDVIKMVADHLEGLNALAARVDSLDRIFEMKYEDMVLYSRLVVDGVDAPWEVVADLSIVNDAYADVLRVLETVDQSIDHINAQVAMAELAKNTTEQIAITVENIRQEFVQWGEDISEDFQTWLAQIEALRDAATAASTAAQNAQMAAEAAQTGAQAAQTSAVDARNAAVASRDAAAGSAQTAAGHVSTAASHANAAAGHASSADAAANDAGTDAIQAAGSAVAANNYALAAQNHANTASTRKDEATAAANLARDWANKAPNQVVADGLYSARHWAEMAASVSTGAMMYMGGWSAASGSYPTSPQNGWMYKVTLDGTVEGVAYAIGDQIIYNGTGWDKIDNTDAVTSVAGRVGAVELTVSDIAGLGALALQSTVHWGDLDGVPNFSLSGHTHTKGDVGLSNVDNTSDMAKPVSTATATALAGKADAAHSHGISDVSGLQDALDGRMLWLAQITGGAYDDHVTQHSAAAFSHPQASGPSDMPIGSQASVLHLGNAWGRGQMVFPNMGNNRVFVRTGTRTEWAEVFTTANFDPATKADAGHTHTIAQITGLQAALDGKAAASHTHGIADVTGLQVALDLLAPLASPTFSGVVGTTGSAFVLKTEAGDFQGRLQHNGTNLYVASDVGDLVLRPAGFGTAANQLWLQADAATTDPAIVAFGNLHVGKGNAFVSVGASATHVGGGIANYNSAGNPPQLGVFAGNDSGNAGTIFIRPDGRASAVGQTTFTTTAANIGTAVNVTGWVKSTVDMEVSGSDVGFKAMPATGRQVKFGSNNSSNSGIYNVTDASWMLRWNASNVADLFGTQFRLVSAGSEFYRAHANSASLGRQPRIFVQSTDPGAAAATGDLWIW